MMRLAVRLIYMVLLVTVTLLPFVGTVTDQEEFGFADYAGAFVATFLFGAAVLALDALTPNKRLASFFGIYLGIVAGLVGALAVGALLDLIAESWDLTTNPWVAYLGLVKLAVGITLCYLAVSLVLTTKDDFRLVIPYVEFAKQVRGVRPLLMDTSALIDGRIHAFAETGFLDAPLVVPQFVINELQTLADSSDRLKRARGRRGLDMVRTLQANRVVDITIDPANAPGHSVDHMLLRLAADQNLRILTTDYNLNKVAQIHGVSVLNLNDLAQTLRPPLIAGDGLEVQIVKRGESAGQGVGYLPEGTMVVVENASEFVDKSVNVVVTNALQTSAGRMIFARIDDDASAPAPVQMAEAATNQPRGAPAPRRATETTTRRNPRR
ncbi:MAG: TRAM domain-containing protein [Phycisphaerales bacterium]|nr:TRAM domain-containing protein [Phycisphaerae bacterium]NNF43981.1 TRAM domain-containing protein [Phycisphaerales bacterium]NNM27785.1 TRAM domain-containing protein [Phycisphaerales bacterium]